MFLNTLNYLRLDKDPRKNKIVHDVVFYKTYENAIIDFQEIHVYSFDIYSVI